MNCNPTNSIQRIRYEHIITMFINSGNFVFEIIFCIPPSILRKTSIDIYATASMWTSSVVCFEICLRGFSYFTSPFGQPYNIPTDKWWFVVDHGFNWRHVSIYRKYTVPEYAYYWARCFFLFAGMHIHFQTFLTRKNFFFGGGGL